MPQFLILAQDGIDAEALQRRKNTCPFHLVVAKELKINGNFKFGGAILNDANEMCGSMMVVEFENEEKLQEWLAHEPYVNEGVWQNIEIKRFRLADV